MTAPKNVKNVQQMCIDICIVSYNSITGTDRIFLFGPFRPQLNALSPGMLFIYVCEIFQEIKII